MTTAPKTLMEIFMEEEYKQQTAAALSQQLVQQGLVSPSTHAAATLSAMSAPAQSLHSGPSAVRNAYSQNSSPTYRTLRAANVGYERLAAPGSMATSYGTNSGKRKALSVVES